VDKENLVKSENQPRVSVGIPTYNRPEALKRTLEYITGQTYKNLEIIVSDNCSPGPKVETIVKEFQKQDQRIKYYRRTENFGPMNNFKFVLEKATSEYFMWASDGDEWDKSFIEACMQGLESSEKIGLTFTNIVHIDSFGRVLREYPSFKKFSHSDPYISIINFILDPECFGKANLIYGVYKIKKLKAFIIDFLSNQKSNYYAYDIALNLGILCRVRVSIDERVLFRKRIPKPSYNKRNRLFPKFKILKSFMSNGKSNFNLYKKAILAASAGTKYEELVFTLMEYRKKLVEEIQAYNFYTNSGNPLKLILKAILPESFINFFKKRRK